MRLIASFQNEIEAFSLYSMLMKQKIESVYEPVKNGHGVVEHYDVWIVSEDDYDKAVDLYEAFLKSPENFRQEPKENLSTKLYEFPKEEIKEQTPKESLPSLSTKLVRIRKFAPMTRGIIFLCVILFFWTSMERAALLKRSIQLGMNVPYTELVQKLLYDFPERFSKLNAFFFEYPDLDQKKASEWTATQRQEYDTIMSIPYWEGFYEIWLGKKNSEENPPMFSQIKKGEYWRLVTPIFLHGNFLHILFNMLWLFLLGREVEIRVGKTRGIVLMALIGVLSNTAQYLMSGPFFLGYSGVLCGLGGFVWMRQRSAPWEGYQVQPATLAFLMIFVLGMMVLQSIAFVTEFFSLGKFSVSQLGNTAHVTGLICGCILAKVPLFYRLK